MDILLTEDIRDPAIERLAEAYDLVANPNLWQERERLLRLVGDTRALMVRNMTPVDAELIAAAGRLEVVGRIGVGLDNLDLPALGEHGVVVCYPPEENAVSVAEHVFALLLALARKVPAADRSTRAGEWDRYSHIGFELFGKTMTILGMGRIGMRVALRARAFGMRVLAYDPYLVPQSPAITESGADLVSLEEALSQADVVSLHLPLTKETRQLLNADSLALMKPTAVVLNTSRGGVIDEAALASALAAGRLGGAGLDVREAEPPAPGPLDTLPNVVLTPHIASWTAESLHRVISTVAGDIDRVLRGVAARQYVNFPIPRRDQE